MIPNTKDATVGRKDDQGKRRWDLVPWAQLQDVVDVITDGAKNYGDRNWQHVPRASDRFFAAAMRHLVAWQSGEDIDPSSGRTHLSHATCSLLFAAWHEAQRQGAEEPCP